MTNTNQNGQWGRAWSTTWFSYFSTLSILLFTPLMVFFFYIACVHHQGSLWNVTQLVLNQQWGVLWSQLPPFDLRAVTIFSIWIAVQAAIYLAVPDVLHHFLDSYQGGEQEGATTPGGEVLKYEINGLQSWGITVVLFLASTYGLHLFSPGIVAKHWGSLLWVANIFGYALALFAFAKAYLAPSSLIDRKFSGSHLYDFYMGIEFNPRFSKFDFKLFFVGRPGMLGWSIINLSFAAYQYQLYGYVTNSMILVNLLHLIYILDFFWYEAWYLKTIDICHDHFGWMFAWGDNVWLPYMYTLQGLYLIYNPVQLSTPYALFVLALGIAGYAIFRSANNQKDRFRKTQGSLNIWGKKAKWIDCAYTTAQGEEKKSKLLTSGWWGTARHFNYTGDLLLSLSYCLACGFQHLLPYFYFIYMAILLVHRCYRDEHRCQHKYGQDWARYCQEVPYRLVPGLY